MERQEFLKSLGISFATVCAGACLSSCGKDDIEPENVTTIPPPTENEPPLPAGTVAAKFTDLPSVGKTFIVGKVLFIRIAASNLASSFVAVFKLCPHQGGNLYWRDELIQCSQHGAQYETTGEIRNHPRQGGGTTSPLKPYPITVTATQIYADTTAY